MLRQRIITALVIAPVALACVFLLPPFEFSLFIGAVLVVAAWEWGNLGGLNQPLRILYALLVGVAIAGASMLPTAPVLIVGMAWWLVALLLVTQYPGLAGAWGRQAVILVLGFWILVPGWTALDALKQMPDAPYFICLLFFLIWGADIGAYFSGRALGRHKLAPSVSPGKSVEGLVGGLVTAMLIAAGMSAWYGSPGMAVKAWWLYLLAAVVIGLVSVLGDLTISMFKRQRGIKDSSNLLPGHGGFLDRIDSLLSASPAFVLYLMQVNWIG